jgi:hypothetical protein
MIATADVDTLAEMADRQASRGGFALCLSGPCKWAVTVRGGAVIIKDLFVSSLWGYVLKYEAIKHDAKVMKQEVIRAGGEILERARLERGTRTDQAVTQVDGIANYTGLGQF